MDQPSWIAPSVSVVGPRVVAENVAAGLKSYSDVMRGWEQSSGHRKNLLHPDVNEAGVAMAENRSGRAYWTLVLGAEIQARSWGLTRPPSL